MISAPLFLPDPFPSELSVNGYYAIGYENLFVTDGVVDPWVEYDFGKVVQIQKVIAKARNDTAFATRLENFEIRVGNTSSPSGDFSASALLAHYPGIANQGEVLVFDGFNPVWGRYLSFQRLLVTDDAIVIAKLYVLGEG